MTRNYEDTYVNTTDNRSALATELSYSAICFTRIPGGTESLAVGDGQTLYIIVMGMIKYYLLQKIF